MAKLSKVIIIEQIFKLKLFSKIIIKLLLYIYIKNFIKFFINYKLAIYQIENLINLSLKTIIFAFKNPSIKPTLIKNFEKMEII